MTPISLVYIFMTALFASLLMVPFLNRWALDRNLLDEPDERKVHSQPMARLGGIAICMAFLFSLLVFVDMGRELKGIMAGVLVIFFTGLVDDMFGMSAWRKLFGQICAVATTMVVGQISVTTLGNLLGTGELLLPLWISIPFTIIAVVGVINAFNLIDGLDGLAGGTSVICLAVFGMLAWNLDNREVLALSASMLGALLGFLKYNFFPARIFMGDAGSLVVGFVVAFVAIFLTQGEAGHVVQPVVPLLVVGLPVADAVWVMSSRLLARQSPFSADQRHVHHKFLSLGFEHRYTVIIIYTISLFWGAVALLFCKQPPVLLLAGYLFTSAIFYQALRFLRTRPGLLSFLGNDSTRGIRESVTYLRVSERVASVGTLLQVMVLTYLGLAVLACSVNGGALLRLLLVLMAAGAGLIIYTRDSSNQYLLAMQYGAGMVIAFVVTRFGGMGVPGGLSLGQWGDILLIAMGLLTCIRFIFRRKGEFYLTSLDYLLVGLTLVFTMAAPQLSGILNLQGVLVRGIIFIATMKAVTLQGNGVSRRMALVLLVTLLAMVIRMSVE
jgi:UDP-GlcNAc:undecaprenyl-phosphate GlcNAc-1-phosphate transferase